MLLMWGPRAYGIIFSRPVRGDEEETPQHQNERFQEETHDEMMDCSCGRQKIISGVLKPTVIVKIGIVIILAVIDSGCARTMLKAGLVAPQLGTGDTPVNMLCNTQGILHVPKALSPLYHHGES